MPITIQAFQGKQGLSQLKPDWINLANRCATHFLHYPFWYEAELQVNESQHPKVYFFAIYEAEQLIAVIPLEQTQRKIGPLSLKTIELFYENEMGVCDILSETSLAHYHKDIIKKIKITFPHGHIIRSQSIPENSSFFKSSINFGRKYGKHSHESKYLSFPTGKEDFWASYNSKFRRNLKRKINKASGQGELRLECIAAPSELISAFDTFLAVENSGWKGRDKTSIYAQPKKKQYYQILLEEYGKKGLCQINLLYLNEQCIAAQFSIVIANTLHLLKIGYNEDYADISPGDIILEKLIDHGCDTGKYNTISFVTGVSWIDRWKPQCNPVQIHYYCGNTLSGKILVNLLKMKEQIDSSKIRE